MKAREEEEKDEGNEVPAFDEEEVTHELEAHDDEPLADTEDSLEKGEYIYLSTFTHYHLL